MDNDILLKRIRMDCPLCGKNHNVEERSRVTSIMFKSKEITYKERFYFCSNSKEGGNEFETGTLFDENLLSARNAYSMMNNDIETTKICSNCKWYENYAGVCFNGISDHVADFIDADGHCEEWEHG